MNTPLSPLSVLRLRSLPLVQVVTRNDKGTLITRQDAPPYVQTQLINSEAPEFPHFPALLLPDGSPWIHGNLYLLSKIISTQHSDIVDQQTLSTIARELKLFIEEIESTGLNYLCFPTRKLQRPTYYYASKLKKKYEAGEISGKTRNKKIGCVIGFYAWLQTQHDFRPENSLWDESTKIITYLDEKGFPHQKLVKSNNLRYATTSEKNSVEGYINDGGALRPYERQEQDALIEALSRIDNTELKLICIFALLTGARIQTVLTLRKQNITNIAEENGTRTFSLKVGNGTGVDTKKGKRFILRVPEWLHHRLRVYVNSPRHKARHAKASEKVQSNDYIFLTEDGLPFYASKDDKSLIEYRNVPKGDALRQTIRRSLQPILNESPEPFQFRFHDLRATFGMNLKDELWARMEKNEMTFMQVVNEVKERLAHSKIETTMQYLNYKRKAENLNAGIEAIEARLKSLV